jgi:hypothetical protein
MNRKIKMTMDDGLRWQKSGAASGLASRDACGPVTKREALRPPILKQKLMVGSDLQNIDEFLDGTGAFLEGGSFVVG